MTGHVQGAVARPSRLMHTEPMHSRPSVSVCIPARNEAQTVGAIVSTACSVEGITRVIVLDHGSTDSTARIAAAAGAVVVDANRVLAEFGPAEGKGDVLWRSLAVCDSDIVVWIDADLSTFTADYITKLAAPFDNPVVQLVRSTYTRAFHGVDDEGGRVTELTARPLLQHLRPDLAHIRQPLSGEYAMRTAAARALPFEIDYGVEVGLTIDTADRFGIASIAQVDLGTRGHRNRPLSELHEQARQVSRAILGRCGHPEIRLDMRPPIADLPQSVGNQETISATT